MSTTASGLKELHQLHLKLQHVQQRLQNGPKQMKARQQIVAQKQAEIESQKGRLKEVRMLADQKTLQLKTNESKIADLKAKLNMAASNREFSVIKSHIEADTMANSVLEDEILEVLEKVDQLQTTIRGLDDELKNAKAKIEQLSGAIVAAEPALQREATELRSALAAAEKSLAGEVAEVYRRLVQAHGAGALAPVENKACGACFAVLSPNTVVALNMGKTVFCRSCGRLLYLVEAA